MILQQATHVRWFLLFTCCWWLTVTSEGRQKNENGYLSFEDRPLQLKRKMLLYGRDGIIAKVWINRQGSSLTA